MIEKVNNLHPYSNQIVSEVIVILWWTHVLKVIPIRLNFRVPQDKFEFIESKFRESLKW